MNIFRPSFEDYLKNITDGTNDSIIESILLEMPLKPISFQDKDGNYGEKHHVLSTLPIFMDWDDIYYLYQFPENLWIEALTHRYTKILYDAKKNQNYQDIQDISLKKNAKTHIFFQRNTFGTKLVDKMERTVDVDHFMNAKEKTPEGKKSYEDKFKANRDAKIDMGGYMGVDMSDPIKTDVTEDMWATKGMMGPHADNVRQLVTAWVKASSHGLLGDTKEYSDNHQTFKASGGPAADRELSVLNKSKLEQIKNEMIAAGAVPFIINQNGSVRYDNVTVIGKKNDLPVYLINKGKYPISIEKSTGLPVLLPGKGIDSESNKKYEDLHKQELNLSKVDLDTVKAAESRKKKIDELNKTINDSTSTEKQIKAAKTALKDLGIHISFDELLKEKGVNPKLIDDEDLKGLKIEFIRKLHSKYREVASKAKSYDNYDWNMHRFNVDKEPHDPLQTGVANPFELGKDKYGSLENKVTKYGTYEPNNQSKSMIHGEEGDWEKYFKDIFSVSNSDGGESFKTKFGLSSEEAQEIKKESENYLRAVGRKLTSDPEVISYLKLNSSNAQSVLSSFILLKNALVQKGVLNKSATSITDRAAPKALLDGFNELKSVSEKLSNFEEELETGFSKSDIQKGVEMKISRVPDKLLKLILEANKYWIILNAENYIKRNLGESIFVKLKKIFQNPRSTSALEKYKTLLNAKEEVKSASGNYLGSIAQLSFGNEDAEIGGGEKVGTRRLRASKDRYTASTTSSDDEQEDRAIGVKDDIEGIDAAIDRGESPTADTLSQYADAETGDRRIAGDWDAKEVNSLVNAFFGEVGKSNFRKFRPNSDSVTHRIGHNISTMYDLMQEEAERAKKRTVTNSKQLELSNKTSVSAQEIQMLKGINDSLGLYNFLVAFHKRKKTIKGTPEQWAKERIESILKGSKMTPSNSIEDIAIGMRYQPGDESEREAVKLYQRIEAESGTDQEVSDKIVEMSKKVNSSPNSELAKAIVDRMRILNHEPPIFDTYKMAASESDVVPVVKLSSRTTHNIQKVANKFDAASSAVPKASVPSNDSSVPKSAGRLRGLIAAQASGSDVVQKPIVQPSTPQTPLTQQPSPSAVEPPKTNPVAERLAAMRAKAAAKMREQQ